MIEINGSIAYDSQKLFSGMVRDAYETFQPSVLTRKFWQGLIEAYLNSLDIEIFPHILNETYHSDPIRWQRQYQIVRHDLIDGFLESLVNHILKQEGVNRSLGILEQTDTLFAKYKHQVNPVNHYFLRTKLYYTIKSELTKQQNVCLACGKVL